MHLWSEGEMEKSKGCSKIHQTQIVLRLISFNKSQCYFSCSSWGSLDYLGVRGFLSGRHATIYLKKISINWDNEVPCSPQGVRVGWGETPLYSGCMRSDWCLFRLFKLGKSICCRIGRNDKNYSWKTIGRNNISNYIHPAHSQNKLPVFIFSDVNIKF